MDEKTNDLESMLTSLDNINDLNKFLITKQKSLDTLNFSEYFSNLCIEKNLKKSTIINDSNISRSYCYEILRGDKIPDRDNALKLCIAASLSLAETNRILKLTNNGILYSKNSRDAILIFCIAKSYTLMQTDFTLDDNDLKTLINCN
ncbi:hypothetical protein [uncultured Clostridium sp.]|jgi:hypothetical protein|uniref:hypothetical protein n=1 Tax=uncultured Clostridium sp. TaxID=59620 RepID=UPI00261C93D2|nr:hypothetical protein [uncultured Clostridium sp.]